MLVKLDNDTLKKLDKLEAEIKSCKSIEKSSNSLLLLFPQRKGLGLQIERVKQQPTVENLKRLDNILAQLEAFESKMLENFDFEPLIERFVGFKQNLKTLKPAAQKAEFKSIMNEFNLFRKKFNILYYKQIIKEYGDCTQYIKTLDKDGLVKEVNYIVEKLNQAKKLKKMGKFNATKRFKRLRTLI